MLVFNGSGSLSSSDRAYILKYLFLEQKYKNNLPGSI